jgi:hypothetical protein
MMTINGTTNAGTKDFVEFSYEVGQNFLENSLSQATLNSAFSSFFSKYGTDLIAGKYSSADAVKLFGLEVIRFGLGGTITDGILSDSMEKLSDALATKNPTLIKTALGNVDAANDDTLNNFLKDIGFTSSEELAIDISQTIGKMASDFIINSHGWSSTQYANAASATIITHAASNYLESQFGSLISKELFAGIDGGFSTFVTSLINGASIEDALVSAGMSFATLWASQSIASTMGISTAGSALSLASVASSLATAGIGIVVGLALTQFVSTVVGGKHFDPGQTWGVAGAVGMIYGVQENFTVTNSDGTTRTNLCVAVNDNYTIKKRAA